MMQILYGDRLGKQGRIRVGTIGILFDEARVKVLLTRRQDNGQWCLPGGGVEPGESVSEACCREMLEETSLTVKVKRLVSVFSDPNRLVIYGDGSKIQFVVLAFEVELVSGEPALSDETTDVGWHTFQEAEAMDIFPHHLQFIRDALEGKHAASIR